jgi:8-oxo-dGTP pyrophosphatase MutT (NUDIX family)
VGSKVKTLDAIRRRLAAPRAPRDPRARLLGNIDGPISPALREMLDRPGRPASVLLALLERRRGPTVLFTERAAHLKDHAGQVSLPGGRIAAGETPAEAALREAHEEVGLDPAAVDVIGALDEFLTGTGFAVMPVVG